MAKQLELRRGTTQANNLFTGATGEVTMDTDTKQLRVHDGVKAGGYAIDTLVAFQAPSAGNNYTWYRKYASGWVEQGGTNVNVNEVSTTVVTLPIEMADTYYTALAQNNSLSTASDTENGIGIQRTSTTTVTLFAHYINPNTFNVSWEVKGMAA